MQYNPVRLTGELARAHRAQGVVEGKLAGLGFEQRLALTAEAWSQEAVATAAIEGERIELAAVRSSVARRLGVGEQNGPNAPRNVEGLLDVMDDAVRERETPLTHERLYAWQAALFPTGYSGMTKVLVGAYRRHTEPMQIVSGRFGREKVHYEAPPSERVPGEMDTFLAWFNAVTEHDNLVKAALAHLWFESIHPFEDGNGRIGRALIDLVLAREGGDVGRLIGTSQRLLDTRAEYYAQLERAQHGDLDVTEWVLWFVQQVKASCEEASDAIDAALAKALFWTNHRDKVLTARQRKVVNLLLDAGPGGFEGGMSTKKYESVGGTSRATASRELIELEETGLLRRTGAGRSTRYYLNIEGWGPADSAREQPPV
jgi:Fic family protein